MNRLKLLRKERKLNQITLAIALHATQATVSRYESEKIIPDISYLIAAADYFDVSVDYLLNRSPFRKVEGEGALTKTEVQCLNLFNSLKPTEKRKAIAHLTLLNEVE